MLLPATAEAWTPHQIILDYKERACYGAMIHYPKSGTFEELRAGFNARWAAFESPDFAEDPSMAIWRNEDEQFTIQLTEKEESFLAIYVCFIDGDTMGRKLGELYEEEPELFDGMLEALEERDDQP